MLSILKSALNANTKEIAIVSNNIANVNSTAFKKSKTILSTYIQETEPHHPINILVKELVLMIHFCKWAKVPLRQPMEL